MAHRQRQEGVHLRQVGLHLLARQARAHYDATERVTNEATDDRQRNIAERIRGIRGIRFYSNRDCNPCQRLRDIEGNIQSRRDLDVISTCLRWHDGDAAERMANEATHDRGKPTSGISTGATKASKEAIADTGTTRVSRKYRHVSKPLIL